MPGNLCIFDGFLYLWYASKQSAIVIIFWLLVYMGQKNKETYGFILVATGLLIGFFLGAGIVYLFSNRQEESLISEKPRKQLPGLSPADLPHLEANRHDSLLVIDTLTVTNMRTGIGEITPTSASKANAINIRTERLIGIRGFYLPSHNNDDQNQSFETLTLDSLLGGTQQTEQDNRIFYIEFWESPLNYTRYRMTKNRIVVFGLSQVDFVSLKEINNTLFLKYYEDYFPIKSTLDFKPLIPYNDSLLINKLEQPWP